MKHIGGHPLLLLLFSTKIPVAELLSVGDLATNVRCRHSVDWRCPVNPVDMATAIDK